MRQEWKQVRFERVPLYAEVWSSPMTQVAAKYEMSDTGLRKVCKAMNIPIPPAGYWAKRAAGQVLQTPPLPLDAERTVFISNVPVREPQYSRPGDGEWLRERLESESKPDAVVAFNPSPTRFHPLLRDLASELRESAQNHQKELKRRDAYNARRATQRSPGMNVGAIQWMHLDRGFLVDHRRSHVLRVTWRTYQRALAIADALVRAAVHRGCSVELDEKKTALTLRLDEGSVFVSIRERQEDGKGGPVPTDKLAIVISGAGEIVDEPGRRAEERIGEVFPKLYRNVISTREWKRRWAAEEEEKARKQAEEAAAEAALAEQRRREAKAAAKKQDLLIESAHWQKAQQLRAYVGEVLRRAGSLPAERKARADSWAEWAEGVALSLDPVAGRLLKFSGDSSEE